MDLTRMNDAMRPATAGATRRELTDALASLRHRLLNVGGRGVIAWAILIVCGIMVSGMAIDSLVALSDAVRLMIVLLALLLAAGVASWLGLRLRRAATPIALARNMDRFHIRRPHVVGGVELMNREPARPASLTDALAALAVVQSTRVARQVNPLLAVPSRIATRPMKWLAGAALALICVPTLAPRLVGTEVLRFVDPFGDHPPYSGLTFAVQPGTTQVVYGKSLNIIAGVGGGDVDRLTLISRSTDAAEQRIPMFRRSDGTWSATLNHLTVPITYFVTADNGARSKRSTVWILTLPKIESVELTITPPAYTRRPAYTGPMPPEGIHGLAGTRVQVTATSNRPLQGGRIDGVVATSLHPTQDLSAVRGSFAVTEGGTARLTLTDIRGQPSEETFSLPIALDADQRPTVRIVKPLNPSFATPDAVVDVQVQAEDDFGISRLTLYRSLNDSRPLPITLEIPTPELPRVNGVTRLSLSQLGLRPGDVIKLFARAEDNDPASAKGSESDVGVIRVLSHEEMDRMLLERDGLEAIQARYAAAQDRVARDLARLKELEASVAESPATPADEAARDALSALAEQMERDASAIEAAAGQPLPVDLDRNLASRMSDLAVQLRESAEQLKSRSAEAKTHADLARAAQAAAERLKDGSEAFDRAAAKPIEHLAQVMPLLAEQQEFIALAQAQRSLASRMNAATTQPTSPGMTLRQRELEAEQRAIAAQLEAVLDRVRDAAAALPAEDANLAKLRATAQSFERGVRASDAALAMRQAAQRMSADEADVAAERAAAAATTLESFVGQCNATGDAAGTCLAFNPSLSNALGNSVRQLLAAASASGGSGVGTSMAGSAMAAQTPQNVGLYGANAELTSKPSRAGDGGQADHGVASDGRGRADGDAKATFQQRWQLSGTGAADVPVPANYRERVSDYFRRVVDELSGDAR